MEYIHNTEQFQFHNTVVALGKFDGMHKGHQLIFDELIQYKQLGYQAAVFSFDRPPLNMLKHKHMRVIYTTNEKIKLLARRGIDITMYRQVFYHANKYMTKEMEKFVEYCRL